MVAQDICSLCRHAMAIFLTLAACGGLSGCFLSKSMLEQDASKAGLDLRLQQLVGTAEANLTENIRKVLEIPALKSPAADQTLPENIRRHFRWTKKPVTLELSNADCRAGGKEVEYFWDHRYVIPEADTWYYENSRRILPCTLWFTIKDGAVAGYRYEGSGCDRTTPTKPLL